MLKKKLKLALVNAGLNEALADVVTVKSESEIETIITYLKQGAGGGTSDDEVEITPEDFLASKAFSDYIEQNGIDAVFGKSKKLKSVFDQKVSKATDTYKSNLEKKLLGGGNAEEDEDDAKNKKPNMDDAPDWAKALLKDVAELKREKQTGSKLEQAKAVMEKSKLPKTVKAKWLNRIDLDSEVSYEEQIKGLESEYKELHAAAIGAETYDFPENSKEETPKPGELKKSEREELARMAKTL